MDNSPAAGTCQHVTTPHVVPPHKVVSDHVLSEQHRHWIVDMSGRNISMRVHAFQSLNKSLFECVDYHVFHMIQPGRLLQGLVTACRLQASVERERWAGREILALSCNECQQRLFTSGLRPAERRGVSPEAGIAGQPGAKPMKFRPLHDRVVIRRIEGEDKTKGGIIIPDTAKEKPQEGEVIAAGPGRSRRERQAGSARTQSGRPGAVRQMVRHRGQDRRRGPFDHEGVRRHGRDRGRVRHEEKGGLKPPVATSQTRN